MATPRALSSIILLLGASAGLIALALIVRCYMPCPFGDEWFFIDAIARGNGPSSWHWLWSQHNEHRLAMTRILVWLDLVAFRGKNVSLFVEIYLLLIAHLAIVCYALEHLSESPPPLKRTLQGIFAFCIFHPNQNENLTWAFQVSWILAFAIGTGTLLSVAFFERFRRPWIVTAGVAVAPILAGLNVSGGLLIGPVAILLAIAKRVPWRFVIVLIAVFFLSAGAYVWGLKFPDPTHPPIRALADPKGILVYVLTYFGASWTKILPHKERITALLSIVCFVVLAIRSFHKRKGLTGFEWFCIAECSLMLAIAAVTALGRLRFGVGQAYASRYQTPAMLYWGALCSLVMIRVWRARPDKFKLAQAVLIFTLLLSVLTFNKIWRTTSARADLLREACNVVATGGDDKEAAKRYTLRMPALNPVRLS